MDAVENRPGAADGGPRAAESETATARRSISGCCGPRPDRVNTQTLFPPSASRVATVQPTGPAPVTTCHPIIAYPFSRHSGHRSSGPGCTRVPWKSRLPAG